MSDEKEGHRKVKTDFKRKRAEKRQQKTYDAITSFFDTVTFGLSTPKKNKESDTNSYASENKKMIKGLMKE
mgnify:CR=1 FL=1|tara:strand:+ start:295 stop:507 length:213 start_codon:yes stop_codon:yes gene_type:complete